MKFRYSKLVTVALLVIISMSACTRNFICHCDVSYSGQPGLPDTTFYEYKIKDTKKKAKSICEGSSSSSDANGIHTDEHCYLY